MGVAVRAPDTDAVAGKAVLCAVCGGGRQIQMLSLERLCCVRCSAACCMQQACMPTHMQKQKRLTKNCCYGTVFCADTWLNSTDRVGERIADAAGGQERPSRSCASLRARCRRPCVPCRRCAVCTRNTMQASVHVRACARTVRARSSTLAWAHILV